MKPSNVRVSIIIVNYNAGAYLAECVHSIVRCMTIPYEIVIVDNRSDDGSLSFTSHVDRNLPIKIVRPGNNIGFGAGCNLGASESRGDWLHFLNPDTIVGSSLDSIYRDLINSNPRFSVLVTKLADTSGTIVKSGFLLPTLHNYLMAAVRASNVAHWYRGASVLMHRDVFNVLGGWSTYTLAYSEDVDLFFKAWKHGILTEELDVAVIHAGEGCTRNFWDSIERRVRVEKAAREFYRQNQIAWQYIPITAIQILRNLVCGRREGIEQGRAIVQIVKKTCVSMVSQRVWR